MAHVLWSQDFFAKGELSPLMYSRVTLNAYYQGLKRAKNVICYPQGSAGKRFGTIYKYILPLPYDNYQQIYFKTFQYLNECCYLLIFYNDAVDILLEGQVVATVTGTGILADEVQLIDDTTLENRFRITTGIYPPKDLLRTAQSANVINGFTSSTLTLTTAITNGLVIPIKFTTTGSLPVTTPQIHLNKTYFMRAVSTSAIRVFSTAQDAAANVDYYTISSAGVTSNVIPLNGWALSNVAFKNLPVFDFTGGYSAITFTPAAQTGYGITLTASAAIFTSAFIGGLFSGNSGIARIITYVDTTHVTIDIVQPFAAGGAIPGKLCLLAEPAWSATRGYPRKCSSFQNRAFFANTELLSNGVWGSVTNDFDDFNGILGEDDDAISWFPTSDTVNYIQFIVPYRSLTIHTNSGVYSTPLSVETALTPKNFSLSLQDSTPANNVQPRGIDNQIIVLSGNDAHSLLWDGFNNAYTSSIISIVNEQLIRNPIDEASYIDQTRAGSRYMLIVNESGTLAIYQTLISENVSGFTSAELEQSYGNAYFRGVASNFDGRAWFLTERELATASSPVALIGNTSSTLEATASNFSTTTFTACLFAGVTLPITTPQIDATTFYWAVGVDANNFKVYLNQEDAEADENSIVISDFGTTATVTPYPLVTRLLIEQLSFDTYVDCAGLYPAFPGDPATDTITGQTRFNAQEILMQGDGFGYSDDVVGGEVEFRAHGVLQEVSEAQYGFPINVSIVPMPLSISTAGGPKSSNLSDTQHIRFVTFLFADTIGGTITNDNNTTPITMNTLVETIPGEPPVPTTGSFEMSIFAGWNDFTYNSFTINHSEPFDIKLTGIFYKVDA